MLRLENITTQYDNSVIVLRDISLKVKKGEIICILGSNGAGKTTLLKTITNLLKPLRGQIYFEDKRIDHLKTHQIIRLGISVVPEGRRLFPEFTVYENLRVGAFSEKNLAVIEEENGRTLWSFSCSQREAASARRDIKRRGAGNAYHCQGLDGIATDAPP